MSAKETLNKTSLVGIATEIGTSYDRGYATEVQRDEAEDVRIDGLRGEEAPDPS